MVSIRREILENIFTVGQHLFVTTPSLIKALQDDIKAAQKDLETGLINVVSSREPYPVPGRALRNLVASCFLITLHARGFKEYV